MGLFNIPDFTRTVSILVNPGSQRLKTMCGISFVFVISQNNMNIVIHYVQIQIHYPKSNGKQTYTYKISIMKNQL